MTSWIRAVWGCALAILLSACAGRSVQVGLPEAPRPADSFIHSIESMKHSVAPVICMDGQAAIQEIEGTAFFISRNGDFLTAAHVIENIGTHSHSCAESAIYIPAARWDPKSSQETFQWYPFAIAECEVQHELDVAKCRTASDLSRRGDQAFEIKPVEFEWSDQPDGTLIAFTGFPFASRDPLTSRGGIAAYQRQSPDHLNLIIDQAAWPGASGSPVYRSDGHVVGILVARGTGDGTGTAVVRPAQFLKRFVNPGLGIRETTSAQTSLSRR